VTIPYTPTAAELNDPECLIIWYPDGSGNPVSVPDGGYAAATGTMTITTAQFSVNAGGFNVVRLPTWTWYGTAVDFIAVRGITTGTGNGKILPGRNTVESGVSRHADLRHCTGRESHGQFHRSRERLVYELSRGGKAAGRFRRAGDDKFAPDPAITRQEMFTPLKILKHFLLPNVQRALPLSYRPCRAHNDKPQGKKPCGLSFLVEIIGIESLTS
jgi:hypothetical protein